MEAATAGCVPIARDGCDDGVSRRRLRPRAAPPKGALERGEERWGDGTSFSDDSSSQLCALAWHAHVCG